MSIDESDEYNGGRLWVLGPDFDWMQSVVHWALCSSPSSSGGCLGVVVGEALHDHVYFALRGEKEDV